MLERFYSGNIYAVLALEKSSYKIGIAVERISAHYQGPFVNVLSGVKF